MAGEVGQVTAVLRQEQDRILVSLPLVGFPPGFGLSPGDQVVLVHDERGPAVRPLLRAVTVHERPSESDGQLVAGEHTFGLQAATVREELHTAVAEDEGGGPPYIVWVVERADGNPKEVFAFRAQSQ
jgi:hypothetical protein